jgi:HEAT repeat protein
LAALYALEEFEAVAAPVTGTVAKSLAEDNPFVRWAAARVLGRMAPVGAAEAVPALAKRMGDESGAVRVTVLAALERYGPAAAPAVKELAQALKAGDVTTRVWAARTLGAVGAKARGEGAAALVDALSAKEVELRRAAVRALTRLGPPDDVTTPALRRALTDPDNEVRRLAGAALLEK